MKKRKKRLSLQDMAMLALKKAVREVVQQYKKTGRPLAAWKKGKVVMVSADKL